MRKYLIADTHFAHNNIDKFRNTLGLSSEEQHEHNFEQLKRLGKKDLCFILGDFCFSKEWLERIEKETRCQLRIIGGNHDLNFKAFNTNRYHGLRGLEKRNGVWLSHAPIHPMELRFSKNCHGHTHFQLMLDEDGWPDDRYINVCLEYTGYKPILWDYAMSDEYHQECVNKWKEYRMFNKCI